MIEELNIRQQEPESGWDDFLDAVDNASDQDRITWLTDEGKRIAAIVPVDVAEQHEAWMDLVTNAPAGRLNELRRRIRLELVELGLRDLASQVGVDPLTLGAWQRLLELAKTAKAARS